MLHPYPHHPQPGLQLACARTALWLLPLEAIPFGSGVCGQNANQHCRLSEICDPVPAVPPTILLESGLSFDSIRYSHTILAHAPFVFPPGWLQTINVPFRTLSCCSTLSSMGRYADGRAHPDTSRIRTDRGRSFSRLGSTRQTCGRLTDQSNSKHMIRSFARLATMSTLKRAFLQVRTRNLPTMYVPYARPRSSLCIVPTVLDNLSGTSLV
ncbi:uncharacterized protein LY79DRAFT_128322 [Colletotrichum navitas]|uniref:Secreted protein n=1 Tax=Colletotrichum navitas TaxID=681940 RepID=A0AAD8V7W9_9PEZI|nr:uncharacterized protein LY79DRAFT_128322 [Colletotrichum navitas]KAK1594860.1 hypothetical protein LY79DRAFT_128322 [Colletotrichum navitas]